MAQTIKIGTGPTVAQASYLGTPLNNLTDTVIFEMNIPVPATRVGISISPTVQDLTALRVEIKFHPEGPYVTLTTAVSTTLTPPIAAASGTLATLTKATSGWFITTASGVYAIRVSAQCATDGTGLCDAHGIATA